jgi:hypothetical protein
MSNDDRMALKDNVSKLITEFNKISNTNINILEDKIRDVREAVELADEVIIRINSSLSDMGIVARRMQEAYTPPLREISKRKGMEERTKEQRNKETEEYEVTDTEIQQAQQTEIISLENKENMPLTENKFMSTVDISLPAALPLSKTMFTEDEPVPLKEVQKQKGTKAQKGKGTKGERGQLIEVAPLPERLSPISKTQTLASVPSKKKEKAQKKHEKPVLTPLPRTATKEEKREVINELISAGFSVEDISKAVGLSQTEVQLILGLKKKRG